MIHNYRNSTLKIIKGNIFNSTADVIVNPANKRLMHTGGLAAMIAHKAGAGLCIASRTFVDKFGEIETCQNIHTAGYDLPYSAILHVVGPQHGEDNIQDKIVATTKNAMITLDSLGYNSIAFPAFSTGIFGVSLKDFMPNFIDGTLEHFQANANKNYTVELYLRNTSLK